MKLHIKKGDTVAVIAGEDRVNSDNTITAAPAITCKA